MDDAIPYLLRGIRQVVTDSSILVSSSRYLNDARVRDWVATHMLRRSGHDRPTPSDAFMLSQILREVQDEDRINALWAQERRTNKAVDRWLGERFNSTFTLEDLGKYQPGTLARRYYDSLVERGFQVELVPSYVPKTDADYYRWRAGQTHDLEHIVGGGGFDYLGELVPYFMRLTNFFKYLSPELAGELSAMYILGGLRILTRAILHYPWTWPTALETVLRGTEVGKASGPFFLARYEDAFDLPLEQARAKLGIRGAKDVDTRAASDIWEENVPPRDDPQLRLWQDP
jgi:ubiquinone biosynthesis protein COQ4